MSEIKDRQDAASDIDPIVAALADDTSAAAAVEGFGEATEPVEADPEPAEVGDLSTDDPSAIEAAASEPSDGPGNTYSADTVDMDSPADAEAGLAEPMAAEVTPAAVDFTLTDDALELTAGANPTDAPAELIATADIASAIEAALAEPVVEADVTPPVETYGDPLPEPVVTASDATRFAEMPAAYADTIVELDDRAGGLHADDDGPLLDGELEDGIASVFAALHAAREDSAPVEPLGDLEAADGVTFRLLGELDRLWHRAA